MLVDPSKVSGKQFLITGGAGFIGSHIVRFLIENGAKVRVLDNLLTGFYKNLVAFDNHPNFEFLEGDITDLEVCQKACKGVEFVSHQAALGSVPRSFLCPEITNEINSNGFLNVLIAAKEAKVRRFVYASSSSVYGDEYSLPKIESKIGNPLSPYAVSKYTNELYAKVFATSFGMKILGFRYFNVFGPHQDPNGPYAAVIPLFIDNIMKGEEVFLNGDGKQTRDFTYVANAVQANILGMMTENESAFNQIYNIAYGQNYSLIEMIVFLEKFLGINAKVVHREDRAGDIRDSLANIEKAKQILNYNPTHNFEQGLIETVDYFKKKK